MSLKLTLHLKPWLSVKKNKSQITFSRKSIKNFETAESLIFVGDQRTTALKLLAGRLEVAKLKPVDLQFVLNLVAKNWLDVRSKNPRLLHVTVYNPVLLQSLILNTFGTRTHSPPTLRWTRLSLVIEGEKSNGKIEVFSKALQKKILEYFINPSLPKYADIRNLLNVSLPPQPENPQLFEWEPFETELHLKSRGGTDIQGATKVNKKNLQRYSVDWSQKKKLRKIKLKSPPRKKLNFSFENVINNHKSRRGSARDFMELQRFADFLFYSFSEYKLRPEADRPVWRRRTPSGGGRYENRVYVVVDRVRSLPSGFYYYDGRKHTLVRISTDPKLYKPFLVSAEKGWSASNGIPQAMVILNTQLFKLSAVYDKISYRITLLNAGVLLDHCYKVSTALGLRGCAIGTGNISHFSAITGIPWKKETSIAEFAIGE